ncbi:hypothetical protein HMP0721_2341 [Pseudoramibacter alactolyticus ATCC 23263]|uniref:Uncharacterized protein n=1 Tax=Pseudoramibacter alactolyticus ATCC 23263 TaxID=887929 RepID=E6MK06_9FIRM|nr:hypothetical protein HMP0721_2341 [Pseudoramibacter alactolyticus ATCC 23263]
MNFPDFRTAFANTIAAEGQRSFFSSGNRLYIRDKENHAMAAGFSKA